MNDAQKERFKDRKLTKEKHIEGVGTIREYGELNIERLVKRLLKSKSITG
jgi:hypothetical protein